MKKLLLTLIALLSLTMTNAQFQFNKSYADWGYLGAKVLSDGNKQLICTFNPSSTYPMTSYHGKFLAKNSNKGIFGLFYTNENINSYKATNIQSKKTESWGGSSNGLYRMIDFQDILDTTALAAEKAYSVNQAYWKPQLCMLNLNDTDQVWAMYPGMYKKVNLGFQIKNEAACASDISFDMMTYDQGNTTKAVVYKMIVALNSDFIFYGNTLSKTTPTIGLLDSISEKNIEAVRTLLGRTDLYVVDSVYTTSTTTGEMKKVTINVAEAMGLTPSIFNARKVYIQLYTPGTTGIIATMPGTFDPTVAIDNIMMTYAPASWAYPIGIAADSIVDHNNGNPVLDVLSNTDYLGGTPVEVNDSDSTATVSFKITSINRASELSITEANDASAHASAYSFPATGAIKAKSADGTYSTNVSYTLTTNSTTNVFTAKIAAPSGGTSNDTLQVTLNAYVPKNMNRSIRLEITNGTRFWYDITAKGVETATSAPTLNSSSVNISSVNGKIFATNATEKVTITNTAGQTMKIVSADQAASGVPINQGVYIVKTGSTVQKVLVK